MRARMRPVGAGFHVRDRGTVLAAVAWLLLGVTAAVITVVSVPLVHRTAVAGTAAGALVLWCVLVFRIAQLGGAARQAQAELSAAQGELNAVRGHAAALQHDLSAGHNATAALRAALDTAKAESDLDRAELQTIRGENAALEEEARSLRSAVLRADEERIELATVYQDIFPAVVERLRAGYSVDSALAAHPVTAHTDLLRSIAVEIGYGERQRAAALAVCATAAGRVQALATSMHAELREMQHRHGEDVLGDLLSLDHSTAQVGRMADSIAVLTGARSGRRWTKPIGVESILRGALGRIGAYQRVRLHSASTAAVAGYAAEGVMHVLAELLDNAANFSAPPAEVHVYVEEARTGLVISVEDGGLGLSDSWLHRAEQAVSGQQLDLTALSAGTRLGLAVVGSLARKHGLSISFRPSARGGTGVVVLIPEQLISHPAPDQTKPLNSLPTHTNSPTTERRAADTRPAPETRRTEPGAPMNESGLPQRRRGQTLVTNKAPAGTAAPAKPVRPLSAGSAAARFGAFRKAVQQGHNNPDAHPKDDD